MGTSIQGLKSIVQRAAAEAGFDLSGIASAADTSDLEHFPAWIAAGRAGEMKYLEARDERGDLKRASLSRVAPWAKSVIVCAINYNTDQPYSIEVQNPDRGWISRYAWSRADYHGAVLRRLKLVEAALNQVESGLETCSYVDTGPIVERVFAKYAGIGWTGKNTCLINQAKGSWLFLGVILCSLELEPDLPAPDRCGTCIRCIQACPTGALLKPYELDSNRCIAYLTIEKRGSIPEEFRAGIGQQVFGCDICQDVCPWNSKAPHSAAPEFAPRDGLVNPALDWLAEMSAEEFRETFCGSPVRRAKHAGLRRNAVIAMGNSGRTEFVPTLEKMTLDEEQAVSESAIWAIKQLKVRDSSKSGE